MTPESPGRVGSRGSLCSSSLPSVVPAVLASPCFADTAAPFGPTPSPQPHHEGGRLCRPPQNVAATPPRSLPSRLPHSSSERAELSRDPERRGAPFGRRRSFSRPSRGAPRGPADHLGAPRADRCCNSGAVGAACGDASRVSARGVESSARGTRSVASGVSEHRSRLGRRVARSRCGPGGSKGRGLVVRRDDTSTAASEASEERSESEPTSRPRAFSGRRPLLRLRASRPKA